MCIFRDGKLADKSSPGIFDASLVNMFDAVFVIFYFIFSFQIHFRLFYYGLLGFLYVRLCKRYFFVLYCEWYVGVLAEKWRIVLKWNFLLFQRFVLWKCIQNISLNLSIYHFYISNYFKYYIDSHLSIFYSNIWTFWKFSIETATKLNCSTKWTTLNEKCCQKIEEKGSLGKCNVSCKANIQKRDNPTNRPFIFKPRTLNFWHYTCPIVSRNRDHDKWYSHIFQSSFQLFNIEETTHSIIWTN